MGAISTSAVVLHDSFIDQFQDDKMTLGICGLVCRDWLTSSRRRLFRSVALCPKSALKFITLLDSPSCTITNHIRILTLREGRGQFSHKTIWVQNLITRLQHIPGIQSLTVEDLRWSSLGVAARSAFVGSFRHLTCLRLSNAVFETLDQVVDMISAHPELEELQLDGVSWNSSSLEPLSEIPLFDLSLSDMPSPGRLQTLHLGCCPKEDILHWLLHRRTACCTIHSLTLDAITPREGPSVTELLRVVGPSLKSLDLRMSRLDESEDGYIRQVDLGPSTQLRSIKFSGVVLFLWRPMTWIPLVLSQITSPSLRDIHFSLSLMDPSDLDLIDWLALEHLTSSPLFSNLCTVGFSINGAVDKVDVVKSIKSKLKNCDDRGILKFNL